MKVLNCGGKLGSSSKVLLRRIKRYGCIFSGITDPADVKDKMTIVWVEDAEQLIVF